MAATYVECKDREGARVACEAGILHRRKHAGKKWERLSPMDWWYVDLYYHKVWPKFAVLVDDEE